MSTNYETMRTSIKNAAATRANSLATAVATHQGSLEGARSLVGYIPGFPTRGATFISTVAAANAQKLADLATAEMAQQGAVFLAKDLLRSQGEIAF